MYSSITSGYTVNLHYTTESSASPEARNSFAIDSPEFFCCDDQTLHDSDYIDLSIEHFVPSAMSMSGR